MVVHGSAAVATQALKGLTSIIVRPHVRLHPVLVNGTAGVVVTTGGRPMTVIGFTVAAGKIVAIDAIADPDRVRRIAEAVPWLGPGDGRTGT
jgi:RNA polymerase sigma-70 factor (ECF subfamily)